jgi:plastocyanin
MPPAVPRETTSPRLKPLPLLTLVGALLLLSGCGGGGGDVTKGKQLFTQACGSCHTLADAGTKGVIGPNLDDAFKQDIADGLGRDTIEGVVDEQIQVPQGGQMPANLVKGDDRKAVAAYVASAIGKGSGSGTTGTTGGGGGGTAKANAKDEVEIPTDPSGQLAFKFKSATARAGKVTLLSKNDAPVPHDISIKGGGVDERGKQVSNGGTSKVSVNLKPGNYEFYCSVPGHEPAGMKGTLTVK